MKKTQTHCRYIFCTILRSNVLMLQGRYRTTFCFVKQHKFSPKQETLFDYSHFQMRGTWNICKKKKKKREKELKHKNKSISFPLFPVGQNHASLTWTGQVSVIFMFFSLFHLSSPLSPKIVSIPNFPRSKKNILLSLHCTDVGT